MQFDWSVVMACFAYLYFKPYCEIDVKLLFICNNFLTFVSL